MKAGDLFEQNGELHHKLRTTKDLISFLSTRENKEVSNYSVLLGAGASRSSGISTAQELIHEWMMKIIQRDGKDASTEEDPKDYLSRNHAHWFDSSNPYSSLFEKNFDLASQRRRFVEQEVDGKLPSIGYAYLVSLVENNFFNALFTTNFDDLLNEAFYQLSSTRPIVCAHDSSVHGISITSKRPKIVKLHGDYLFEDIKSTLRETESLEQNTKDKFIEFCKEYGLIVVGYSGSDRSIMDVLEYLNKRDNYLKNGLYWCFRREDEVNATLKNLLWKERVYPVFIDGFDEFFAELHEGLCPNSAIINNRKDSKSQKIVEKIINEFSNNKNTVISSDVKKLQKEHDTQDISDLIADITGDRNRSMDLSNKNFKNLLEVDRESNVGSKRDAYEICQRYYGECDDTNAKVEYLKKLIRLSEEVKPSETDKWATFLIETDTNNFNYHLRKLDLIKTPIDKTKELGNLTQRFSYSYQVWNQFSDSCFNLFGHSPKFKSEWLKELGKSVEKSLQLDPSLDNPAWIHKYRYLSLNLKDGLVGSANDVLSELVNKAKSINQSHLRYLDLLVTKSKTYSELEATLLELQTIRKIATKTNQRTIDEFIDIIVSGMSDTENNDGFVKHLDEFYPNVIEDKNQSCRVLINKAIYKYSRKNDTQEAEELLGKLFEYEDFIEHLPRMVKFCSDLNSTTLIERISRFVQQKKNTLVKKYYYEVMADLEEALGNFDEAVKNLDLLYTENGSFADYISSKSFNLLRLEKYDEAIRFVDSFNDQLSCLDEGIGDAAKINRLFALKKINRESSLESEVQRIKANSKEPTVKIACQLLCENTRQQGLSHVNKMINKDFMNYHLFENWVLISKNELDNLPAVKARNSN